MNPKQLAIIEYYRLIDEAQAVGVPTSMDDPKAPRTIAGLRHAVARAKAALA